jgi:hypothetical protein
VDFAWVESHHGALGGYSLAILCYAVLAIAICALICALIWA